MGMIEHILTTAKKYDLTETEILEAMGRAYALKEAKKPERIKEEEQMKADAEFKCLSSMGALCVRRKV